MGAAEHPRPSKGDADGHRVDDVVHRVAQKLVSQYGVAARAFVSDCAGVHEKYGDATGVSAWRRVGGAVDEILSDADYAGRC